MTIWPNTVDFEIHIGRDSEGRYTLSAWTTTLSEQQRTHLVERQGEEPLAPTRLALARQALTLLDGGRPPTPPQAYDLGGALFALLFGGALGTAYDQQRHRARRAGQQLRLRLTVDPPELAVLPWELLFDKRGGPGEFICLANVPVVRSLNLRGSVPPFAINPPLRILAMSASPNDQPPLNIAHERRVVTDAIAELTTRGLIELHWIEGQTWQDLQRALRRTDWHVFHFVGHGGFDTLAQQGYLVLGDEEGRTYQLGTVQLGRLLSRQSMLRLALLSTCEGARSSADDLYSSTAAGLLACGIPAVLAMQYVINDRAATAFARTFYQALADDDSVDVAASVARQGLSMDTTSVEWAAPVLYLRAADAQIVVPAHMLLCPRCSTAARIDARFCMSCGYELAAQQPAPTTPSLPVAPLPDGGFWPSGTTLGSTGRYRIERLLGKGGFSEVYLAADTHLGRPCVIKHLVIDNAWSEATIRQIAASFEREARLLATLNTPGHPNIPEIYEVLPEQRSLVLKYVGGQSLQQRIEREGALSSSEALRIAREICAALVYMHGRAPDPILHRDITPSNIIVDEAGRIWLVDFGLAKTPPHVRALDDEALPHAGTPGYTAPEQWQGRAEPHSDVYALAATLQTLLSGVGAPVGSAPESTTDIEIRHLIARGSTANPAERPTAAEFLDALDALLNKPSYPLPPEPQSPPATTGFVGRERELRHYARQLAREHIVVLTGMAGVGKTALAATLARQIGGDGLFWYAFHQGEGIGNLRWPIAGFLAHHGRDGLWQQLQLAQQNQTQLPPPDVLIDYAVQLLRGGDFLLCFDDIQYVRDDAQFEKLFERLRALAEEGEVRLLLISRTTLDLFDNQEIVPLSGLSLGDVHGLVLSRGLELSDALLAELTAVTEGNAQLLLLAINALRQANDPARLLARLSESHRVGRFLLKEVDAHLGEEEREVLSAVAVLLGYPSSRQAISAVLGGRMLRRTLSELSDRYLLTTHEDDGDVAYSLHSILRGFYYEQLSRAERRELHRRAAAYYEDEEPNLLLAARHYERADEDTRAADLITGNYWALLNLGQARAASQILDRLQPRQLDTERWISVLLVRGELYSRLLEHELARAALEQAIDLLSTQGDTTKVREQRARAFREMGALLEVERPKEALDWLRRALDEIGGLASPEEPQIYLLSGRCLMGMGDHIAAQHALEQSLSLLPEHAALARANVLNAQGGIAFYRGDLMHARTLFQQALTCYQETREIWRLGLVRTNLGLVNEATGDWPGAIAEYSEALAIADRLGDAGSQTMLELNLGFLLLNRGEFAEAEERLLRSLALAYKHNLREYQVNIQATFGDLHLRQANWLDAEGFLLAAKWLAIDEELRRDQLPEIYRGLAQVRLAHGDADIALQEIERSLAIAGELEMAIEQGKSLRVLAQIHAAAGRVDEALAAFAQSQTLLHNSPYEAACTQMAWGLVLGRLDQTEQSRELLMAAHATFSRLDARHVLATLDDTLERETW